MGITDSGLRIHKTSCVCVVYFPSSSPPSRWADNFTAGSPNYSNAAYAVIIIVGQRLKDAADRINPGPPRSAARHASLRTAALKFIIVILNIDFVQVQLRFIWCCRYVVTVLYCIIYPTQLQASVTSALVLDSRRHPDPTKTPRSSTSDDLCVPAVRLPTVGRRAFSVAVARVWNALPADVTSAPSLLTFRKRLKLHLFPLSYPGLVL